MSSSPRSSEDKPAPTSSSRRSFLQSSAGVASTVALTVVTPAAAAIALNPAAAAAAVPADPAFPVPTEPIAAYLRDAASGEVTVLSGTVERTYRDPVLAKRLLDAARAQDPTATEVK